MTWAVHVKQGFGQGYRAATGGAQLKQGEWVELQQADMLGHFIFAAVEVVVGHFHALDVQIELFASEQTLLAGQVAELKIAQFRVAQLMLQGTLGLLRYIKRKLEALPV